MTQTRLKLATKSKKVNHITEFCEAVGLSSDEEAVTIRFMRSPGWGGQTRQVTLERSVAEQLIRMLNDELEDGAWAF
jgi:hypothetical protein